MVEEPDFVMTISQEVTDPPKIPPEFYRPPERIESPLTVETRPALLPFGELGWQTFERLCLRLTSLDSDARYAKLNAKRVGPSQPVDYPDDSPK